MNFNIPSKGGEILEKKRYKLNLILNEIKKTDDPTILPCSFIIMDFEVSGNNVLVDKDTALEGGKTLINKPIVTAYKEVEEYNTNTDNFSSHEQVLSKDRYGNDIVKTNTIPIGVFTTEGYLMTVNVNGEDKEVMVADAVLWQSRFPDACDLIQEWYENGIKINTSCEYIYSNFSIQDGIEYHNSPIIFEGHCILASENRGSKSIVLPAYESSKLLSLNENDIDKFNKLVAQAINQKPEHKEENKMEFFKKICELSHSDIRSLLYKQLDPTLGEGEYSWISDVYESYFVVELSKYTESESYDKYFKFDYTKGETDVTINFDSKSEVVVKRDWVEVTQVEQMQNSLNEKAQKLEELETQLNESKSKFEALTKDKETIEKQFNDATEKLTQLNSQVKELKPFKDQVEKTKFEKSLNEKKEFYSSKFEALNAKEKFGSEEVQSLVEKSVFENEEGKQATLQLNSMLVDMVTIEDKKSEETAIKEFASKRENLIPEANDFNSRYSL